MSSIVDIREALSAIQETFPDEAKLLRAHLDGMLTHPLVLAERAIRATELCATELDGMADRLGALEAACLALATAETARLEALALLAEVEAEERMAALQRSEEKGQWLQRGVTDTLSWVGKRSEAGFALVVGAFAAWLASKFGGSLSSLP